MILDQIRKYNQEWIRNNLNNLKKDLGVVGLTARAEARQLIMSRKGYATRTLLKSIAYKVNTDDGGYKISLEFGSVVPYARDYEIGGNRKFDYWQAKKWAAEKVRLGILSGITTKNYKTFAYFVSKKIQRFGTQPHPTFAPAFENAVEKVFK